jgi:hypothetical protein
MNKIYIFYWTDGLWSQMEAPSQNKARKELRKYFSRVYEKSVKRLPNINFITVLNDTN